MFGPCSLSVGGPGVNQAAFEYETTGLPTAPGTYPAVAFIGSFDTGAGFESITSQFNPTGTMTLTISLSPTPGEDHFNTKLTGFRETPSILTNGTGTFAATLDSSGTSLSFTLKYANLSSNATQAHIHFAEPGVAGNIIVFLCAGPKPACPASGGTVTGTITGADVLAVSSQGVTAGTFSDLLRILRSGDAYVNVHTANHPAGEIRGQLATGEE
jgi:CHRD domain